MILKAKHNFFLYPFFQKYAIWKIGRNFHQVVINSDVKDNGLPIIALSNHISWWDGFWVEYLNLKLFKRKFHFMMLESQLKKLRFFNYVGGYSVSKKSKSIFETINYSRNLLADKRNFILLFPQGEIESIYNQSIKFEKGIERIVDGMQNKVQMIFLVNMVDYFSNPKPSLYMNLKSYNSTDFSYKAIEVAYISFFSQCVENQLQNKQVL